RNLRFLERAVEFGDGDFFSGEHFAVKDARDREATEVVAVVEISNKNLQRPGGVAFGRRSRFQNRIEERTQIFAAAFDVGGRGADFGVGVENGEVELIFFGVEIDEEIVDFVQHFLRAGVSAVDLVDDDD